MLIPIRDDKTKYIIDSNNIICIQTNQTHVPDHKLCEDVYYSTIDIICHKDLTIKLLYKDVLQRNGIFDSIYKTLEGPSKIVDNSLTKAIEPIMRKDPKFIFDDICIGGSLYDN